MFSPQKLVGKTTSEEPVAINIAGSVIGATKMLLAHVLRGAAVEESGAGGVSGIDCEAEKGQTEMGTDDAADDANAESAAADRTAAMLTILRIAEGTFVLSLFYCVSSTACLD